MPTAHILDHLLHLINDKRMTYRDAIALTAHRFATHKHIVERIFYRS
jgi:hypothetical protein